MKKILVLTLCTVLLLGTISIYAQDGEEQRTGLRPDAPSYAVRGPYPVGTREYVIDNGERPLPATVWYPAQDGTEETTYIHIPEMATVPTVEQPGHAILDGVMDLSGAPYPLVIHSHGNMWYRQGSAYLAEHLASHGFVVIAADHTGNTLAYAAVLSEAMAESVISTTVNRPSDIQRQIDYAAEITADDGVLPGMIDMERIAVTGHSYGGYTALAAAGAQVDMTPLYEWCQSAYGDREKVMSFGYRIACTFLSTAENDLQTRLGIDVGEGGLWPAFEVKGVDAIVPLAPSVLHVSTAEGLAGVQIPVMVMGAAEDSVAPFEVHAGQVYANLPEGNKTLVVFEDAEHQLFVSSCFGYFDEGWLWTGCIDPVWDTDDAHDLINHFVTAFLLDVLYGDEDAHAALLPESVDFPGISYETTME